MNSGFDSGTVELMRANERNWDARAPIHAASRFYGADGTTPAESWFAPFEWDDLGPLADRDLIRDDASGWWRLPPTDTRIPLLYAVAATKSNG
ncbi:hypothetical protein [Nocardia altamirensis]|uniref:hypothetical protein n=1 Tax=Nocardia altamirensis TaxID=472158 RepID=UPI00157E1472|nr:hypothetical protein [Nocardia altamirensis]